MFYVLVFSLLAVVLVVAGLTTMSRRRRNLAAEEAHTSYRGAGPTHSTPARGTHPDAAGRRKRKAMRAQSQHDRRKRH